MSELHKKIDELIELYKEDQYVMSRLETFIMNHLPNSLASASELKVPGYHLEAREQAAHSVRA